MTNKNTHKGLLLALIISALIATSQLWAADSTKHFDIQAMALSKSLAQFSKNTKIIVLADDKVLDDKQAPALTGDFESRQALDILLADTELSYEFKGDNTVIIHAKEIQKPAKYEEEKFENEAIDESQNENVDETEALDIVVVTGSNLIVEPSSLSRQVDIFDIEEIRSMGAHDLDTFFKLLPQNIASASRVGVGTGEDNQFGSARNVYGSSSINLRGIGDGTTLILVDGRRTARGGVLGEAVDTNNFPLYMIERIEIIYDGASAIYGSDAIGGVVNIITKKDYEGTNIDISHSRPSQGGTTRTQVDIGHTFSWDNSRLTLGVSGNFESALDGSERNIGFGAQFPTTPFGLPGNISSGSSVFDPSTGGLIRLPLFYIDPATGERIDSQVAQESCFPDGIGGEFCFTDYTWIADLGVDVSGYTPIFTVQLPEGHSGALSLNDINDFQPDPSGLSDVRNITLIPKNDSFSFRTNYAHDFANDVHFEFNTSYNQNDTSYSFANSDLRVSISQQPLSPFTVNASLFVAAEFLPIQTQETTNNSYNLSGFLDGDFSEDWHWEVGYSLSKNEYESYRQNTLNRTSLFAVEFGSIFDPVTGESTPSPFDPFATLFGLSSEQEFTDAFIVPEMLTTTESENSELDFKLRGAAFTTNAGDASVLFGAGVYNEKLDIYDESTIIRSTRFFGNRGAVSAYDENASRSPYFFNTEIYIPLVGEKNSMLGIQQLSLTGAYRYDDYESVFTGESWAVGLIYSPSSWLDIVTNITESFKAPNLADSILPTRTVQSVDPSYDENREEDFSGILYTNITGGNLDLGPELGETKSIGIRFTPESMPEFRAEINYSENQFTDKIGSLAQLINTRWTPSELELVRQGLVTNPVLSYVDGGFVQDFRSSNISDQRIRNLDAKVSFFHYTENIGSFAFNLSYNKALENAIRLVDASLCNNNACDFNGDGENDLGSNRFVDRVAFSDDFGGLVFPEHRATFNINWDYKGFGINAIYLYQSDTQRVETILNGVTFERLDTIVTTTPVKPVNLQFSYDFTRGSLLPTSMTNARIVLTIPNVFNEQLTISRNPVVPNTSQGRLDSRATDPYGRVYTLRFQASF